MAKTTLMILLILISTPSWARVVSSAPFDSGEIATRVTPSHHDPFTVSNSHFAGLGNDTFSEILKDPLNRVQLEDFKKIPAPLRSRTLFWLKIYGMYSSHQFVLFDSEDPSLIYEVIDLRPLQRSTKNAALFERQRIHTIEQRMAEYRQAFSALEHSPKRRANPKTDLERRLVQLLTRSPSRRKKSLSEYHAQFRGQTGQRDHVLSGLKRARPYWRWVEDILVEQGVPADLAKLALVESSFNFEAVSRVGAQGVWQFMPDTAKNWLTLRESAQVDERLSPLKATLAAARLLRHNRQLLGSWPLAIVAFHSGTRPFIEFSRGDLRKIPIEKLLSGGEGAARLGWAGRNYYPEFLAMNLAVHYEDWIYNTGDLRKHAIDVQFLSLKEPMTLLQVSKQYKVGVRVLMELNPDIESYRTLIPTEILVAVPSHETDLSDLLSTHDEFANSFLRPYWEST